MNLILHLLKKDLRYLRPFWLGWLILAVLSTIPIQFVTWENAKIRLDWFLLECWLLMLLAQFLILAILIARLVQSETLWGTTSFWMTRPIARHSLLAAKLLWVGMLVVILPLAWELSVLLYQGVGLIDVLWSIPDIVLRQLAFALPLMALAALTPDLLRFIVYGILTLCAYAVLYGMTKITFFPLFPFFWRREENLTLNWSGLMVTLMAIPLVAMTVLLHQYLRRAPWLSIVIAISGGIFIISIVQIWPWDFLQPMQPALNRSVLNPDAISISLEPAPYYPVPASFPETMKVIIPDGVNYWGNLKVTGVPAGYLVIPERIEGSLHFLDETLRFGNQKKRNLWDVKGFNIYDMQITRAVQSTLSGVQLVNPAAIKFWAPTTFAHLTTPDRWSMDYKRLKGQKARYTGKVELGVVKYEIAGTLPIKKGEKYHQGSTVLEILDFIIQRERLYLKIKRSDSFHFLFHGEKPIYRILLHHKKTGEAIFYNETSNSLQFFGEFSLFPVLMNLRMSQLLVRPATKPMDWPSTGWTTPAITPEWLADAELMIVAQKNLGVFSKSLLIDPFILGETDLAY